MNWRIYCTKKIDTFCCLKKLDIGAVDSSRRSLIGYFLHYILQWPPWERKTSLLCVSHRFCTFSDSGIWVTVMPPLVSAKERVIRMSCEEITFIIIFCQQDRQLGKKLNCDSDFNSLHTKPCKTLEGLRQALKFMKFKSIDVYCDNNPNPENRNLP